MTRYSLRKIMRKTGGSSKRILLAFKAHASSGIPRSTSDPLYNYYQTDFTGNSFMVNPHELINNSFRWRPKEVAQYIALASLRNFGEYIVTGSTSLDLLHSPVDRDILQQNRLLRIRDDRIYFYYEEVTSRRKEIWH